MILSSGEPRTSADVISYFAPGPDQARAAEALGVLVREGAVQHFRREKDGCYLYRLAGAY